MEAWAWLTVYLVGFALLQLALYRYFRGDDSASTRTTQPGDGGARTDAGPNTRPETAVESGGEVQPDQAEGAVHCKHCGALNERNPTYTYCRQCAQPIQ
jgi:hypothetical protein